MNNLQGFVLIVLFLAVIAAFILAIPECRPDQKLVRGVFGLTCVAR